jgi:isoleucyl-tRNA synthetase
MTRRRKLILGGLAAAVAGIYLLNASWLAAAPPGGPTVLSHRGVAQSFSREKLTDETCTAARMNPPRHGFLENTLPSLAESFRHGADVAEIDVHPTTDGHFVVFHDWTVDCRTEGKGETRSHSLAELKRLDVGYGYTADGGRTFPFRGKGVGMMPTLEEVLRAFPDKRFLINIKSNDRREADALVAYLDTRGLADWSRLSAYGGWKPIERLEVLRPQVRTLVQAADEAVRPALHRAWLDRPCAGGLPEQHACRAPQHDMGDVGLAQPLPRPDGGRGHRGVRDGTAGGLLARRPRRARHGGAGAAAARGLRRRRVDRRGRGGRPRAQGRASRHIGGSTVGWAAARAAVAMDDQTKDYRATVFLPKTDFPMKASLPQKEPAILARWQDMDLYRRLREARAGREKFILHDGPPYANGDMHIGHAMQRILKDVVVRTQSLLGKDAPFVPGWDCHGLPIEWKVEEQYRARKKNKDEVPVEEFRAECRAYAQHWVNVQREQIKRLGVIGDWDNPYLTMDFDAEATIVAELLKFAASGQLYRGAKPVMWSPVEKTALAEAEVEYEDITSTQVDVAFEIVESPIPELVGAYAVIWTTTPWTVPVNQAIAYGPDVEYALLLGQDGSRMIVAEPLRKAWQDRTLIDDGIVQSRFKGSDLAGAIARHPMHHLGGFFAKPRPLLPGEFVTTDSGTGLVHMAPDHGEDDFHLCKAHGIDPVFAVEGDGKYREDWAWLGGQGSVINPKFNAPDGPICSDLREAGALLAASADYRHSYPHSWRSKAKVMDAPREGGSLGEKALAAIEATRFVPEKGRNRIRSMVEGRPDWVLSRQRAWGVPITLFVDRKTGQYLNDPEVNARIVEAVRQGGVDAWNDANAPAMLGDKYRAEDYERVTDILDVWFDSGSTHAFVLESGRWPDLRWPADLYLEGSDQHRGWFQSSLLESCGTRGRAPYDAVLTHGFTMDAAGKKMSKSLGNTVDPIKLMQEYGADIIRLWALSVDFTEDHRIGKEILAGTADAYRKLRNTFRYLLGALDGFSEVERVAAAQMPELERYVLHLLADMDGKLRQAVNDFDFNSYVRLLSDFANNDLSAFFFDIRKDSLYCDAADNPKRRAYRTVLDTLFHALVRYLAPVLVFTSEEVWGTRYPDGGSVHLLEWPEVDAGWLDEALGQRWERLRELRVDVTGALEPMRREKVIGSSLEAVVTAAVPDGANVDLAELFIVSEVRPGAELKVDVTGNHKCGRCWRHLPEVSRDGDLCNRCSEVVDHAA